MTLKENRAGRIIQSVSFASDDLLVPQIKRLVRERRFSEVCRQALTAWFAREEDEGEVITTLKRIEQRLAEWKRTGVPPFPHGPTGTSLDYGNPGNVVKDVEGTSAAANALDSY